MLAEFEKLDKLPWDEKLKGVVDFIGYSEDDLFRTVKLHKEGQNYLKNLNYGKIKNQFARDSE